MNYKLPKQFSVGVFTLLLVSTAAFADQAATASTAVAVSPELPRLDAPVTPANSVLYDFGGAILRVPKILFPETMIPKDPKQPIKGGRFSMVFQYPDMVQSEYQSELGSIVDTKTGGWEWSLPKPGRFPVKIKWLFYSPGGEFQANDAWENANMGLDRRPQGTLRGLEVRVREGAKLHNMPDAKVTFIDAKYAGLREVQVPITDKAYQERVEKMARESGWNGKKGAQYIEKAGSPYELFLRCDAPDSIKCTAYVYIKNNHFQYQMIFPPSQVEHADKLISTINKMIDGWVQK